MGGVDLADQRRLTCNSTVMGKHRWWLKLFFYLLDVGTSNALILYRGVTDNRKMNLFHYKKQLVHLLVGERLAKIEQPVSQHILVRIDGDQRLGCAYCNAFGESKRTRYICQHPQCKIPLCSVGSNCDNWDCFVIAHSNEKMRKMLMCQGVKMQQKANNQPGARNIRRRLNIAS